MHDTLRDKFILKWRVKFNGPDGDEFERDLEDMLNAEVGALFLALIGKGIIEL